MSPLDTAPDTLWTAVDVAAYLRVSRSWVYKAAEASELPCLRIGAMLRFDPDAIRSFVKSRTAGTIVPAKSRT